MLGMGEPKKQNGEERRARLGVKPSSAAVPDENVQEEKTTNVSHADPGPPRKCRRDPNSNGLICRLGTEDLFVANEVRAAFACSRHVAGIDG
jgi:hypothetical protein